MDIGSGKISPSERNLVPHHLIDVVYPDEPFDLVRYCSLADIAVTDITSRGAIPLFVGGTLLYLDSFFFGFSPMPDADPELRTRLREKCQLQGLSELHKELESVDPVSASLIHPNDAQRIIRALEVTYLSGKPMSSLRGERVQRISSSTHFFSPRFEREVLYGRIDRRVDAMVADGFIDEVDGLIKKGYNKSMNSMNSIGYSQIYDYITGEIGKEEAVSLMKQMTRKYAKKQITWLNRYSQINFFENTDYESLNAGVRELFLL
jgi:tRNA dimethylallyltransferase